MTAEARKSGESRVWVQPVWPGWALGGGGSHSHHLVWKGDIHIPNPTVLYFARPSDYTSSGPLNLGQRTTP